MRSTERNGPISVIGRVSAIIGCFAETDTTLTVGEIARRTGIAKTTVWRLSSELAEHGLLDASSDGLSLGLRLFELGESTSRPRSLRRLALARMEALRQQTGLTVHLAVIRGVDVVYIEILHARASPKMPSRVGGRVPAHATGVGKALLAFSPAPVLETVLQRGLEAVGPHTITDPDALRAELARVRERGIATEREESAAGVACVAVPIVLADGAVTAALSVSGPADAIDPAALSRPLRDATEALQSQAERLSRPRVAI
ncbi:IclR family transcriptional regulator [Microbacterium sp. RD1]|uniref:IclR family transcriptional regulator n=1 Tax=Microbacterium sp. RD1 TaxID=3457313 RepID=UPI003FA5B238